MGVSDRQTTRIEPPDAQTAKLRQDLEDVHESLLLLVMALEEEWLLDDRISYSLQHPQREK